MAKLREVYKCDHCGILVEVLHGGGGTLICCGADMELQAENTVDAAKEKHVPVIEQTDTGVLVKVGSAAHPMEEKHYIEWIEIIADGVTHRAYLEPGQAPEAEFAVDAKDIVAREYCTLHGFWQAK
jgi:superoxide reductase